ncbi:RNA polymerase sigma factor [Amphiplicatus metriothermophilus]|uniref:RNA polymerase sigma-70 factor, ECF subfamily n=1 Tax=Amphiplicatus metriothermophilus TaxID=1519374 RepID=A0A239PJ22_9PROT|nr:sigma-70 family RNA polymerase sigma factor [Amphiplicatus metriothermophilus]MBB5517864.1 RNA polymerase sigma-70 factor (ECF subfamily) [Amphiplicatus metriothermophilus]SNT67802.1 RNA polymerase sigma-70 factor, ECF subfamily [Amphiplicatus metriothermophilus]
MRRDAARVFDEYLVAAARAGDRAAFDRLAARWAPRLYRHACRLLGDAEAAEDAAQEGWADIARGLSRLEDAALFPAWALRIVTRRCADGIRRGGRERRAWEALAREPESPDRGAHAIEARADGAPLVRALAALPAEQRATVALFYLEDLSVAEIAAALAVPAGTVKTRLMHARRKLRDALEVCPEGGKYND